MKPLRNQVFATRDAYNNLTESGLVIPDAAQENPIRAIVTAVGPECVVKPGDKIVFDPRGVIELRIYQGSKPLLCMEEKSVLAVLTDA